MSEHRDSIHGIGRDDFVDEQESSVEVRTIRSGRGKVDDPGKGKKGARATNLEPEILCGPDGRMGWRLSLPDGRPLATPAVVNGRLFTGGGFGSYSFYTVDADTGRLVWKIKTKDDGPTAATVAGEYVAFNTESCTVYVVDASSGRVRWQSWLGDPLMAQTAIHGSTLYMVYPDRAGRHQMAAFDLERGKPRWKTEIVADVISAPVVVDGSVYATSIDGTVHRIDAETGKADWSINHRATSAPWIHRGRVYMSLREEEEIGGERVSTEGYDTASVVRGERVARKASSRRKAEYLQYKAGAQAIYAEQDAGVGFGSEPLAAKLSMAKGLLGVGHVASVWSFQGSRPEVFDDGIFSVLDDVVQRLELGTKKPLWRVRVEAGDEPKTGLGRTLSPPAVSGERLYVSSNLGDLFVLDRESGEELWSLNVGAPIVSQPAVAEGKVFLGTSDGDIYAFETGDTDPVGWPMWGGGPGHNGS